MSIEMNEHNENIIPIPFVLPPFSNLNASDSIYRYSPLSSSSTPLKENEFQQKRQRNRNGKRFHSLETKIEMSVSLEAELGRLESEVSQLYNRTWSQVAHLQQLQHHDIEGQRSLWHCRQHLENALCQVIRYHSQRRVCKSIVQSKHHNFDLGDPIFDLKVQQQQNRRIETMVNNAENWLGGCLRKYIPFANQLLHVRRGDLIWVRNSSSSSFMSPSSSSTSSTSEKSMWKRCIVLAIKSDLFFPRFFKVSY